MRHFVMEKEPKEGPFHSKRLIKLANQRYRQVKDFFHKVSFNIVKIAKENDIDTIVIGKNDDWKQEINLGKKNNQNFVQIPHSPLIELITYKANAEGIAVIVTEESYTSKASFLDEDDIPTYQSGNKEKHIFSGKRISRGMYRSKNQPYKRRCQWCSKHPTKSNPNGFRQRDSGCVFPASSGQCALAPTLKPVTLVMGGSY